ncbi:MAG TPA: hypothetical protein VFF62_15160 [Candidatus Nitrosocosmicus sp.]|nr:hypothetical protein [Candidatus Nitrosocosmicus sp.]
MLLSAVVFVPALGGLLIALLPRNREGLVKQAALVVALLTFAVSLPVYFGFDARVADYQFQERRPWLPTLGISYHLGVDGISLLLVLLTTFLMPLTLLASWHSIEKRWKEFAVTCCSWRRECWGCSWPWTSSCSTSSGRPC